MAVVLGMTGCPTPRKPPPRITPITLSPASPVPAQPVPSPALPPVTPPPAVPIPEPIPLTPLWVPWAEWCQNRGLVPPQRLATNGQTRFELRTAQGPITVAPGNRIATWNGLGFWLGFTPQFQDGRFCLHALDIHKTLLPLVSPPKPWLTPHALIVIDPGHGGTDPGTPSVLGAHWEKEYTLDWAQRLRDKLVRRGWRVLLTRTNDSNLSLSKRVAIADQNQASLFLSLHFNSVNSAAAAHGVETYCLTPAGMPSSHVRTAENDLAQSYPNNVFDCQNFLLAVQLHQALLKVTGAADRTVRRTRFLGVLRSQARPSVLIEGGYLSNPREAQRIADPVYRQQLSEAVARVLDEQLAAAVPVVQSSATTPRIGP